MPWLEHHGLDTLFDVVCTRDDVAAVKPAPDLFLLAAERLGVRPQDCVVFEDSPNGLRAARAAGMWAVAVPNLLTQPLELPHTTLRSNPLPSGRSPICASRCGDCVRRRRWLSGWALAARMQSARAVGPPVAGRT